MGIFGSVRSSIAAAVPDAGSCGEGIWLGASLDAMAGIKL